jgi:hypothetical protein
MWLWRRGQQRQTAAEERKVALARCRQRKAGIAMDRQLRVWKLGVERLWSATAVDYLQAAQLAAEIAGNSEEATLRQAATQALPSLRNASLKKADRSAKEQARRRLSGLRDVLHALSVPQFGKRQKNSKPLTSEERYRQMLGLPLGRGLSASEIHEAYKRVAKTAHPDAGGTEQEFQELSAAKDALMKERGEVEWRV